MDLGIFIVLLLRLYVFIGLTFSVEVCFICQVARGGFSFPSFVQSSYFLFLQLRKFTVARQ